MPSARATDMMQCRIEMAGAMLACACTCTRAHSLYPDFPYVSSGARARASLLVQIWHARIQRKPCRRCQLGTLTLPVGDGRKASASKVASIQLTQVCEAHLHPRAHERERVCKHLRARACHRPVVMVASGCNRLPRFASQYFFNAS